MGFNFKYNEEYLVLLPMIAELWVTHNQVFLDVGCESEFYIQIQKSTFMDEKNFQYLSKRLES